MNTLYLNQNEFESLVEKKYFLASNSATKKVKSKIYTLIIDTNEVGKSEFPVFLSNISKIILPGNNLIPQLRTLYGIPAGLMEVKIENSISSKSTIKNSSIEFTDSDLLFRTYRRALLYANTWTIKSLDTEAVRKGLRYMLSTQLNPLLIEWITELIRFGRYFELKPQKISIDDTLYEYQFLGMGAFLRKYFFPGEEKMENSHREWLIEKLNNANVENVPAKFKGLEAILGGYLIALKASNNNQKNPEFIIEKAGKFNFKDKDESYAMIFAAFFFIGIFESKADQYFYVAGASELFVCIDRFVWNITKRKHSNENFDSAIDKIRDALLQPIENAVKYYKIKNPSVADYSYEEFEQTTELKETKKIYVIRPEQTLRFIDQKGQLINLRTYFRKNILVTSDSELYTNLVQNKLPGILHQKGGIIEASVQITPESSFIPDTPAMFRWITKYFGKQVANKTVQHYQLRKKWVLITMNYQINKTDDFYLKSLFNVSKPEKIVVFNSVEKTIKHQPMKGNSSQGDMFASDYNLQHQSAGSNATLQSKLESLFPDCECRVISKISHEQPWEMVLLGTGVLLDTDFDDCSFVDLRPVVVDNSILEIILRCFRDLIVYDEKQRYMFMNIS